MNSVIVYVPFILLAVAVSVVTHFLIGRLFLAAVVTSAAVTAFLAQLYARVEIGYEDKLWLIAATVQFVIGCDISTIVGLALKLTRRRP